MGTRPTKHFWYGVMAVLLLAASFEASAHLSHGVGQFTEGTYGCVAGSAQGAVDCIAAIQNGPGRCGSGTPWSGSITGYLGAVWSGGHAHHQWSGTGECPDDGTFGWNGTVVATDDVCGAPGTVDTASGTCPTACDGSMTGEETFRSGAGAAIPASLCDDATGCVLNSSGVGVVLSNTWAMGYVYSGEDCTTQADAGDETGNNCISNGAVTYCVDTDSAQNCGTVNGEYVCLDSVPDGACIFTAGGQAICDSGANSQAPTGTVGDNSGSYDVYGNGLDGSGGTSTGVDDGTLAGGGTNGQGGEGPNEESGECDGTNCDGTLPPDNEEVDTFGQLFASFYGRVENAPIIAAVDGLAGSVPAGTCNGVSTGGLAALGGADLTIDAHCEMWPQIAVVLQTIMLAVWAVLGALIILRA